MGTTSNELALTIVEHDTEKSAMKALNRLHKPGTVEWGIGREAVRREFRPTIDDDEFRKERKAMPQGNLYVPTEAELRVSHGMGSDYAIDPETGLMIALNPEAAERMRIDTDTSGSTRGSQKRFPCGSAVVIGITAAGNLVSKVFTLGAASAKPYIAAAKRAGDIVYKGGIALYGSREAGYELHDADTGKRWDPTRPKPKRFELRTARDRKIGKRQVVGVNGDKGLHLIDANTNCSIRPQKALEWFTWLVACGEIEAAERLAIFVQKPKISQADYKLSQEAALAMAEGTPYHERPYIQRFTTIEVDQFCMATRKFERMTVQVAIGCSALDCSLPVAATGLQFNLFWGSQWRTSEMPYDPTCGWTKDTSFGGSPNNHEACVMHALVLAKNTISGGSRPLRIEWTDVEGHHIVTKDEALRDMTDKDEDENLNRVREAYNSGMDPESYALDLCEALDMTKGSAMSHQRDDEWWAAHNLAKECGEALAGSLLDASEGDRLKVRAVQAQAELDKEKVMRKLVPGYVKPGEILTKGPRREVEHDWPRRYARAKNSRKGQTSARRDAAERTITNGIRFK